MDNDKDKPDIENVKLPILWEEARVYLENLWRAWNRRMLTLEKEIKSLTTQITCRFDKLDERHLKTQAMQERQEKRLQDFEATNAELREGMHNLNERLANITTTFDVMVSLANQQARDNLDNWRSYDKEQKAMAKEIQKGVRIVTRQDRWQLFWRASTLLGIIILIALSAVELIKASSYG